MSDAPRTGPDAPEPRRAHRPVPIADPTDLIDAALDRSGQTQSELASSTAAAVLGAARGQLGGGDGLDPARLLDLSEAVGLDTLAQLWRDSPPDTLPGALWALYLLRAWCRVNGEEVARLWRAGRALAPADEVVAGVSDDADPQALETLADAVLGGAYSGDFAVGLERAASFFRVVAAGRRAIAPDTATSLLTGAPDPQLMLAERNERVAVGLTRAAALWRVGRLH
ncbi:MAG: hypothetical protein JWN61_1560 [Pseudonocardiales bacterium]|nr:hypothetical protein [Jatrophihabitantaceae bacterium]MCW2603425.1 hypothetical protein [Pseudonocardiales bacterium]